jgi:arylsulfatase A-like enzyme
MDLTATCLAAAEVAPDPRYPLDGVDLLPVLTDQASEFERTLYWRMRHRYQRAVRRGGWKYLKVADNEYLFDIEYDPRERGDLSKKQPDLLAELRKQWEDCGSRYVAAADQRGGASVESICDALVGPKDCLPLIWRTEKEERICAVARHIEPHCCPVKSRTDSIS